MSRIRGTGNRRTEQLFASALRRAGVAGWRRHVVIKLPVTRSAKAIATDGTPFRRQVRPDFVFPKQRVAVFIDGCFWHGCPHCYRAPKSKRRYWDAKVIRNRERDRYQRTELRRAGWKVLRAWEHQIRKPFHLEISTMEILRDDLV